eukprot:scaffold9074_cov141-Amphora_coffeaeformis.AAC.6
MLGMSAPDLSVRGTPERPHPRRAQQWLLLGLVCVTLFFSFSDSKNERVLQTSSPMINLQASPMLSHEFLYCTDPYIGEMGDDAARMDIWYQCEGPVYDEFSLALFQYVQAKQNQRLPSWGHRPAPLPADTTVLVFGNSHTRQIGQTFACQYAADVTRVEYLDADDQVDPHMAVAIHFTNGAQLILVANSYVAHSPHWQRLLEAQIKRSLASVDAIVMGLFNPGTKHWEREIIHSMLSMQTKLTPADEFDIQSNYGPTVSDMAAVYGGPILFTTMFGDQEPFRTRRARDDLRDLVQQGRHNVVYQNTHVYVDELKQTGASLSRIDPADATVGEDQAHKCTGVHGGHVDLVAWDVREFIFAQLVGSTQRGMGKR